MASFSTATSASFSAAADNGVSSRHRSPVVVGVVAALFASPAWAGHGAGSPLDGSHTGSAGSSLAASKKKPSKGTLAIKVSGSGSYTVTGKGFRKTGKASKSFKVKPGTYTVKAPRGSVKPGKAKVRKGKTTRVTVTFTPSAPVTPTPPVTDPTAPQPTHRAAAHHPAAHYPATVE